MNLVAIIEPIPTDQTGIAERKVSEISVEADNYEDGFAELRGQVPEGWRLMNVRRD